MPSLATASPAIDSSGKLTIDWSALDTELERLAHRGKVLFQLNHPPIEFGQRTPAEKRSSELEYIRALRDHLRNADRAYQAAIDELTRQAGLAA